MSEKRELSSTLRNLKVRTPFRPPPASSYLAVAVRLMGLRSATLVGGAAVYAAGGSRAEGAGEGRGGGRDGRAGARGHRWRVWLVGSSPQEVVWRFKFSGFFLLPFLLV
jgi:hypothetical protein